MARILLLFTLVPLLELALLIEIGRRIGTIATLALILITGVLGAFLARRQGLAVLQRVRSELHQGRLPGQPIADGVLILLAGAMLITPGILTDALGFACLIPATRRLIKAAIWRRLKSAIDRRQFNVSVDFREPRRGSPEGSRQPDDPDFHARLEP
jgi:UPF0716 protein FxsA